MLDWIVALNLIREIPEILSKLANKFNERYLGQIALISPTQNMMDTDTVTGPLAVSETIRQTVPQDTRHMSTAATWSQPEPSNSHYQERNKM